MPELCRFLGVVIFILYDDHAPPHFHAEYGDYIISVEIKTGIFEGKFPKRALQAVFEWYEIYKDKLMENWDLAQSHQPLKEIPPLE
jgi:hypothetical protein